MLADEINRAPAKVQSALLEAMQERQVTIGDTTYPLPDPFLVLATQNPIEQEGTYPLPEAQVDRFMLKVSVTYPDRAGGEGDPRPHGHAASAATVEAVLTPEDMRRARDASSTPIYIDDKVKDYIVDIVFATREPAMYRLGEARRPDRSTAPRRAPPSTWRRRPGRTRSCAGRGYVTPRT